MVYTHCFATIFKLCVNKNRDRINCEKSVEAGHLFAVENMRQKFNDTYYNVHSVYCM